MYNNNNNNTLYNTNPLYNTAYSLSLSLFPTCGKLGQDPAPSVLHHHSRSDCLQCPHEAPFDDGEADSLVQAAVVAHAEAHAKERVPLPVLSERKRQLDDLSDPGRRVPVLDESAYAHAARPVWRGGEEDGKVGK